MLSFFPKPYPDEILYSILARYHVRSGNTGLKLTMQELFNSNNAIATADLPCNLDALVVKLSLISKVTVEDIVQNHTLYPFYAAFLPGARSQQIAVAMRSEDGGGIHDRVGIRASLVSVPRYFRFCSQCLQNDQRTYGELYWHRIHQVPGVLVCPEHNVRVLDSQVRIQNPQTRHEFVSAEQGIQLPKSRSFSLLNSYHKILLKIAQDAAFN